MTISSLFLDPCVVRADMAVIPRRPIPMRPHQMAINSKMVINGTLSWDGKSEKKLLKLTTTNDETIHLGPAGQINETKTGNPIVPDRYIGQQVAVTLIGSRTERHSLEKYHQLLPNPIEIKKVISLELAKGR